jgi:hypothetical protein
MLLAGMLKIFLQQYRHEAADPGCPLFRRYRGGKQTQRGYAKIDVNDPPRTSAALAQPDGRLQNRPDIP